MSRQSTSVSSGKNNTNYPLLKQQRNNTELIGKESTKITSCTELYMIRTDRLGFCRESANAGRRWTVLPRRAAAPPSSSPPLPLRRRNFKRKKQPPLTAEAAEASPSTTVPRQRIQQRVVNAKMTATAVAAWGSFERLRRKTRRVFCVRALFF